MLSKVFTEVVESTCKIVGNALVKNATEIAKIAAMNVASTFKNSK